MAIWDKLRRRTTKASEHLAMPGAYSTGLSADWLRMLLGNLGIYSVAPISPREANNGRDNAIVAIAVNWISTSWMVSAPQVGTYANDGTFTPTTNQHELIALLSHPNKANKSLTGAALLSALVRDWVTMGNAFVHIVQSKGAGPVGLDYLPVELVEAVPDTMGKLKEYRYKPNGRDILLYPSEVVHFRNGIDPANPLLGISPLAAQYREIVTDNSYSDFAAGMAKNGGTNMTVFSPKMTENGPMQMTEPEARQMADSLNEKVRSEPGKHRFIPGSVESHKIGLSPDEMDLSGVRAMPECRIPAALGLPAILLGLYTGMQKSTYSNMAEAIQQGWRGGIIPMQSIFAEAITNQLLTYYPGPAGQVFRWDTSMVPELQDDMLANRAADREDVKVGVLTPNEARERQGLPPLAEPDPEPVPTIDEETLTRSLMALATAGRIQKELVKAGVILGTKSDNSTEPGNVYQVADQYRLRLMEGEVSTMRQVSEEWAKAQAYIDDKAAAILAYIEESEAAGIAVGEWRTEALSRLSTLSSQITDQLSSLSERIEATVESAQRLGVEASVEYAEPLTRAAAGVSPTGKPLPWSKLPVDTFEALIGFASDGSPLRSLLDVFKNEEGNKIYSAMLSGIAAGENPRKVAARLSGATGASRARLENIARTEMMRAAREATRRQYLSNSDVVNGYYRLSAADSRTCVSCWALHGDYQTNAEVMPSHVNCRCVAVPAVKSWAEILGDPTIPDDRKPMPQGEDLFAGLSEADQREVLGAGKYEMYRNGATLRDMMEVLDDPQWGPTTREKRKDEVMA